MPQEASKGTSGGEKSQEDPRKPKEEIGPYSPMTGPTGLMNEYWTTTLDHEYHLDLASSFPDWIVFVTLF